MLFAKFVSANRVNPPVKESAANKSALELLATMLAKKPVVEAGEVITRNTIGILYTAPSFAEVNGRPVSAAFPTLDPLLVKVIATENCTVFPVRIYFPYCWEYVIPVDPPPKVNTGVKVLELVEVCVVVLIILDAAVKLIPP